MKEGWEGRKAGEGKEEREGGKRGKGRKEKGEEGEERNTGQAQTLNQHHISI